MKCPPDTYDLDLNHCFRVSSQLLSWDESSKYCKDYGGVLASIHDTSEQELIKRKLVDKRAKGAWIGLIRHVAEEGL